jgi:hypothetical protein
MYFRTLKEIFGILKSEKKFKITGIGLGRYHGPRLQPHVLAARSMQQAKKATSVAARWRDRHWRGCVRNVASLRGSAVAVQSCHRAAREGRELGNVVV